MTGGCGRLRPVDATQLSGDLTRVLVTKEQLAARIAELAAEIDRDYEGKDLLLVGVLNGAVMVMADLSRALQIHCRMDWMAVSSYGSGTQSSGVVRILKDLSTDITGMHVLVVEDIIDTGLTLSYLVSNLRSRSPASLKIMTAFRKPEAAAESGRGAPTSASTSRTSSWSATAWTTTGATATSPRLAPSHPAFTADRDVP